VKLKIFIYIVAPVMEDRGPGWCIFFPPTTSVHTISSWWSWFVSSG